MSEVPANVRFDHLPVGRLQVRAAGTWQETAYEVDVVQDTVSSLKIVLVSKGAPRATLRGRVSVPGGMPRDGWRRGGLWPIPVTWEGYAAPERLELNADPRDPTAYEFVVFDLQPGPYRLAFEKLGWSETVTLAAGEEKLVEGRFAGHADVRLLLLDEESGALIQSASVFLNGDPSPAARIRSDPGPGSDATDEQRVGDGLEGNAVSFHTGVGENQLVVRAQGYRQAASREWFHPGPNVISMALTPTYPVWLRFSRPVGPNLEAWALGAQIWRYGESQAEIEVIPWRYAGNELTHAYVEFAEPGRYLLTWPRAGKSVAPVELEVRMPRDRGVEHGVPVDALIQR